MKGFVDPSSCHGKHKHEIQSSSDHFLDKIGVKNVHKKEITPACEFFPDPHTTLAHGYVIVKRLPKHAKQVSFRKHATIITFTSHIRRVHFSDTVSIRIIPAREEPEKCHLIHGSCKYYVDVLNRSSIKRIQ